MRWLFQWRPVILALGITLMSPLFGIFIFVLVLAAATLYGAAITAVTGFVVVGTAAVVFLALFILLSIKRIGRQISRPLIAWVAIWSVVAGGMIYFLVRGGVEEHRRAREMKGASLEMVEERKLSDRQMV